MVPYPPPAMVQTLFCYAISGFFAQSEDMQESLTFLIMNVSINGYRFLCPPCI